MTQDQYLSLVRSILCAIGGWATGKGYVDGATATAVTGALVTLATAAWGWYANSQTAKIASINNTENGVKVVAATSPSPVVTTPLK
jgi:hypothetical protein